LSCNKLKRFHAEESGQSLVEFVLVFSVLLILVSMVVDISRIIDAKILLQSAACESVRRITSRDSMTSEVNNTIKNEYDRLDPSKLHVSITAGNTKQRNYIYHARSYFGFVEKNCWFKYFDATVTLNYDVPIITPVGQLILGKSVPLTSKNTRMIVVEGYK
jgi:TadE-like protein.